MVKHGFIFLHILNVLGSREESTSTEIIDELGISPTTLKRTLEELVEEGFARKRVYRRRNYYSITDKGRALGGLNQIEGLAEGLDHIVGDETITKKVVEGIEQITATSSESEIAKWYKGAMDRLDALVDEGKRNLIMQNCGYYGCASGNRSYIDEAIATRKKYKSVNEFLDAEILSGRLAREGDILYQTYVPRKGGMRCYCSLVRSLPANETISPTYCQCSTGFVKKYWEDVLERPVRVELLHSSMSGAQDCKFAIYLGARGS